MKKETAPSKKPNPHKYLLYKPTFSQLFTFLASGFKVRRWNAQLIAGSISWPYVEIFRSIYFEWTNPQLTKIFISTSLDKISSQHERASQN
jgi:hypothetical protein